MADKECCDITENTLYKSIIIRDGLCCTPDLWIGITYAIFQSVGKVLVFSNKFIKRTNDVDSNSAAS